MRIDGGVDRGDSSFRVGGVAKVSSELRETGSGVEDSQAAMRSFLDRGRFPWLLLVGGVYESSSRGRFREWDIGCSLVLSGRELFFLSGR